MLHATQPFKVIPFWDPAVNIAKLDLKKYINERHVDDLPIHPGKQPQVFMCRPIPSDVAINLIGSQPTDVARLLAFRWSVYRVDNPRTLGGVLEGKSARPARVSEWDCYSGGGPPPVRDMGELWTHEEMGETWDAPTLLEVGEVIRHRTFLAVGVDDPYLLPPSSQRLLRRMIGLLAEQSQGGSDGASATSEQPPTTEAPPSDG